MENSLDKSKKEWDEVYQDNGDNLSWTKPQHLIESLNNIRKHLQQRRKPIESMLDYGCGTAELAVALKRIMGVNNVVATDITDKAVNKKYLDLNGIKFQIASRPNEVRTDQKFDLIICNHVFNHIDPRFHTEYLIGFKNLLSENGSLILTGFSDKSKFFGGKEEVSVKGQNRKVYSMKNLDNKDVFKDVGLDVKASEEVEREGTGTVLKNFVLNNQGDEKEV